MVMLNMFDIKMLFNNELKGKDFQFPKLQKVMQCNYGGNGTNTGEEGAVVLYNDIKAEHFHIVCLTTLTMLMIGLSCLYACKDVQHL